MVFSYYVLLRLLAKLEGKECVIFLLLILMWQGPIVMSIDFPNYVRSQTALAKVLRIDSVTSLSSSAAAAMGTGLQYIMLNPFW